MKPYKISNNKKGVVRLHFNRLLNIPVIEQARGKKLGRLSDVLLDENGCIFGIVATNENLVYNNRFIERKNIVSIKNEKILVNDRGRRYARVIPCEGNFTSFAKNVGEHTAITTEGKILGKIKDGIFDMEAGELLEFEISGKFTEDLINGRKLLNAKEGFYAEAGKVYVVDDFLTENQKGLKQIFRKG